MRAIAAAIRVTSSSEAERVPSCSTGRKRMPVPIWAPASGVSSPS
jgi:hypothetical protein